MVELVHIVTIQSMSKNIVEVGGIHLEDIRHKDLSRLADIVNLLILTGGRKMPVAHHAGNQMTEMTEEVEDLHPGVEDLCVVQTDQEVEEMAGHLLIEIIDVMVDHRMN